ncbi:MAG: ribonuclease Y [Candidatus Komeilibacteria bacterium]|nr:ribonuclease Y [Candidatus Komeilibacteria bacterium]
MVNFIILAAAAGVIGLVVGYGVRLFIGKQQIASAEYKSERILQEAKNKQKEVLIEAKDKALQIIEEAKKEEETRRKDLQHLQERLEKREGLFDQKLLNLENKQQELAEYSAKLDLAKEEVKRVKEEQLAKLEKIARLTQEEARQVLMDNMELRSKQELTERVQKLQNQMSEELEAQAKDILGSVIERCAASHAMETTTTVVTLPNDEMKGRIIGREGRNIKTIEQLTGVEIVIDETPEAIVISGFSPIRRHLAKRALDKLIADGRIHPGRIEEAVEEAKKELAIDIKKAGEAACMEVGVAGLDPKLVQILGRLKYRTSYGQNQLNHAIEVAYLSKMLAEELGADVAITKKGGLLHDIGKAVDQEMQGSHPQIGYDILKKFGLPEEVAYICIGHHEDHPKTLEAILVKSADAISGARPGARKDTFENYVQRLEDLEKTATSFDGVDKVYAIQAGREIRVFVKPDAMDDWQATKLARDIADRIEQELKYPGEIKVTVIREKRVIEYAR